MSQKHKHHGAGRQERPAGDAGQAGDNNHAATARTHLGRVLSKLRRNTYFLLSEGIDSGHNAVLIHRALLAVLLISLACGIMSTVDAFAKNYGSLFLAVEVLATVLFLIEYGARIWAAPDEPSYAHLSPWRARLAYLRSALGIIDGLAVLPMLCVLALGHDAKVLTLLRMVRFFKIARYSPGVRTLISVLHAKQRALTASAVLLLGLVLIAAAAMYALEHDVQADRLGSMPDAMWWAIVTLTTVGYGDVVPLTTLGKMLGGLTMIVGLIVIALPIGIVATAFAEEITRQEFVVSWGMIARVPIFSTLKAEEIAEIAKKLSAQTQPARSIIVRKGDPAHAMFFIASGEVEVLLPEHKTIKLVAGQFFGEMAIIRKSPRSATVRAVRDTKLLVLEASDLHDLMETMPTLAKNIQETAAQRTREADGASFPEA